MPEIRECIAFYLLTLAFFRKAIEDELDLTVIALWADAIDSKATESSLSSDGRPYILKNTSTTKRGHRGGQSYLFPKPIRKTAQNPNPPLINTYQLFDVDKTMRSLILGFKQDEEAGGRILYVKIAYLTHTCVQIYTAAQWAVMKETSKFKAPASNVDDPAPGRARIGLGIEMKTHTIAFITLDNLFEVAWEETKEALPKLYVGVYDNFHDFLQVLVDWLELHAEDPTRYTRLARIALRDTQEVFHGIGVYTVCEIMYDAGLPPFITEAEMVDVPSRMARVIEAFWNYAHVSTVKIFRLLKPAMAEGLLAPTRKQRRNYVHWLHVFARDYCRMPRRMADLLQEFLDVLAEHAEDEVWFRSMEACLYDIFDPWFLRHALDPLEGSDKPTFNHLIFGTREWEIMSRKPFVRPDDVLTLYYESKRLLNAPTMLKPGHYIEGGILGDGYRKRVQRHVYYYFMDKQCWSATPHYPDNCAVSPDVGKIVLNNFECRDDNTPLRDRWLFVNITQRPKQVAIGPLEYSANASQATTTHRRRVAHPLSHVGWSDTMAFHRAKQASSSTNSLDEGLESADDSDVSNGESDMEVEPRGRSDYSNSDTDYSSGATSSAYSSDGEDMLPHQAAVDSIFPPAPITHQSQQLRRPIPALAMGSDREDDTPRSPPRKRRKKKPEPRQLRKYTNTNEITLHEAIPFQLNDSDHGEGAASTSTAPPLRRQRSSRNTSAHYCFSARGNAMDPAREKPGPRQRK